MKLRKLSLTIFLSVILAPKILFAVNSTWDGSSSTNLLTNTNWSGNQVPDNNATFNSTALNYTPTLSSGVFTVHQFVFPSSNAQSYTFSLSGITSLIFDGGANNDGVHNDGGLQQTFNLSNTAQITFLDRSGADEGNQPGYISYNLNAAGTKLNFNQAHNLSFGSLIQGSGQVSFGGSAIQTFTSVNTYTGSTSLQSGTLALSGSGSIATSSDVNVLGTLDVTAISANTTTIKNLSGSGSIVTTGKGLIVNETSDTTFSGIISGVNGSLGKSGTSKLTLSGVNTYTAGTLVSDGTLALSGSGSIATSSDVNVLGTLDVTAISANTTTIKNLSGSGSIVTTGKGLIVNETSDTTFSGIISGVNGSLGKSGTSKLTLSGVNTYTAGTLVSDGTLALSGSGSIATSSDVNVLGTLDVTAISANTTTIKNLSGSGSIVTTGKGLIVNETSDTTFSGIISGVNGSLGKSGTSKLTLSGVNTYTAGTLISDGTLALSSSGSIAASSDVNVLGTLDITAISANTTTIKNLSGSGSIVTTGKGLIVNETSDTTFSGIISGANGSLGKSGTSKLTLSGVNTYTAGTLVSDGTLALSGSGSIAASSDVNVLGTLDVTAISANTTTIKNLSGSGSIVTTGKGLIVNETSDTTFSGIISGVNGSLGKSGTSKLTLSGVNTYTAGTLVSDGTLALSDSGSIAASSDVNVLGTLDVTAISANTTTIKNLSGSGALVIGSKDLTINQNSFESYSGSIIGTSTFSKTGSNNLIFTGNLSGFTGVAKAKAGALWLNTTLGGSVSVEGGYFVGDGTTLGNVDVLSGTIGPGSGIGTMNVGVNFYLGPNTTFVTHVDNNGNNSLLNVQGTSTIANNTLLRIIDYESYPKFYTDYLILQSNGGITGEFSQVSIEPVLYEPRLTYYPSYVLLRFIPSFLRAGRNMNQRHVALQLDTITNPTSEQQLLLDTFYGLTNAQVEDGLEVLSGESYANLMLGVEETLNRAYSATFDPLRPYIANPCLINDCLRRSWIEGSGINSSYNNDGHAYSFKSRGYNLSLGLQEKITDQFLMGANLYYEADYYTYNQEGSSRQYTFNTSLFGLYRPKDFYVLSNLMTGGSFGKMSRYASVGNLTYHNQSKPNAYDLGLLLEMGKDVGLNNWLMQPFIGLNTAYFRWNQFSETGDALVALNGLKRSYVLCNSRLGIHLTSNVKDDGLLLGLDAAWALRLTALDNHRLMQFQQFGSSFMVEGINIAPNSIEAKLYALKKITSRCTLYTDAGYRLWKMASSLSLTAGFIYSW